MYNFKVLNENYEQKCLFENIPCANSYIERLIGLMGKRNFNGLIFKQKYYDRLSGSIHTCFMKVPIDIIYVNHEMKIQEIVTLKAWKLYIPENGNIKYIIELPENNAIKYNIRIGDYVEIKH